MTDARLPDRFLTDHRFLGLSDPAWRLLTCALMWSNQQGTDGHIPSSALRVMGTTHHTRAEVELIASGIWLQSAHGFSFVGDWECFWGQSWAEDVEARRASNRQRQKVYREKISSELESSRNQGSVTRYVGQERQDTQGEVGQVESAKRCSKCGVATSYWATDSSTIVCIACETDQNPL